MDNAFIAQYLREQRNSASAAFQAMSNVHIRFQECFATLAGFDFTVYRHQLHSEILQHITYWQRKDDTTQVVPLDALLFAFNSIYEDAVDARAYGIVDWQEPVLKQASGFDMGYSYDFQDGFENVPGFSLSFLQPLEDLLNPETIHELAEPEQNMEEVPGFQHLADTYLFSGLVVVHDVLVALQQQNAFAQIVLKPNALFLLGGHDTGLVYPVMSLSAN